ncbi:hypothetical protein Ancab_015230 [Ancistrocladus abbreviatus]
MGKPHPVDVHVHQVPGGVFMRRMRSSFRYLAGILVAIVVIIVICSNGENWRPMVKDHQVTGVRDSNNVGSVTTTRMRSQCDLFSGKWVFDNESYPLYKEGQCSFMSDQLACEKYGRKNLSYQYWRWQPHHCDLPRFNATALLETLRNKRLVFVGDSLNRGQWMSLVCLVEKTIPPSRKSMEIEGSLTIFKAIEYNATIEYYWAPLLVESNSDDPVEHRIPLADRTVRVNAIERHARHWNDADFLIFNSYLWWRKPTMKVLWGSFESSDSTCEEVEMVAGYKMALKTWSDWIQMHANHSKTQIFWVSMSPSHESSEEWGATKGLKCYNETEPIFKEGYQGSGSYPIMMQAVEDAIESLSTRGIKVQLLNITQLSEYRKDAHLSIYKKQWEPLTQEQLANPVSYADCFHWCLPGVPDTWNQLLYAYIFDRSMTLS